MPDKISKISVNRLIGNIHRVYDEIYTYISSNLYFTSSEFREKFIEELKIIVYELYSNAVNFSKGETVDIILNISDEMIEITVKTAGDGFRLKPLPESSDVPDECYPPFSEDLIGKELTLYRDTDYSIIGNIEKNNSINFFTRQDMHRELNLNEVSEHFGLFLIGMLSDNMYYRRYNNSEDVFTVRKRIG